MKNKLLSLFIGLFFIGVCVSGAQLVKLYLEENKSRQSFNQLIQVVEVSQSENDLNQYAELKKMNSDFIGWIQIEDTILNYPVMQSVENLDFYLTHDFEGNTSKYGVPYVDEDCDLETSENLIIYGHHMKNKTMFGTLVYYAEQEYLQSHSVIRFDTMDSSSQYEVFAAFPIDIDHEYFAYNTYINFTEEKFNEFIEECQKRSSIHPEVSVEYGDHLLTLSTCDYSYQNGRFVVVARKIK